jgi:hypothetical protein
MDFSTGSNPAHKAKMTQKWCKTHFLSFITLAKWSPYLLNLNLMDYSVWSILEARACAKYRKSLELLKQSLRRE